MRTAFLGVLLVGLLAPSVAVAATTPDEIDELVRSIDREAQALTTDDCTSACKALASMRRATERLCELDPVTRCADARAKLRTATAKVQSACPACSVEAAPKLAPEPETTAKEAESAPPSERARGGCAGCATTGPASGAGPWVALAALATLLRRRRAVIVRRRNG